MPKSGVNKTNANPPSPSRLPSLEELLDCSASAQEPLQQLLNCLIESKRLPEACALLHQLADSMDTTPGGSKLILKTLDIPGAAAPLRLILSPSVFSPEHWGRAFAEGLLKSPELFHGKKVVELGTGSGWISLLLLLRTGAAEILALDINPTAVLIAKLNAWLNGTTRDGALIYSKYGIPIVHAVQFMESDLLSAALDMDLKFDHVVGCIPQVLHPDESAADRTGLNATESDLYDLSNYCFQQGILEDQFGLPLIARALEESQLCLNQGGKVTLVLGGRPGPAAIESMFKRRGFESELVWSRRIHQADDTDLASLVSLERAHGIRFHFFMSRDSQQPICAETAVQLLAQNRPIFHDLLVYQASTRWEQPTFSFVRDLHKMGLSSLRNELDLSRVSEEQMSFLSRFSSSMLASKAIPYPHERGDLSLRRRLANFLLLYCHYKVPPEKLFIAPDRAQLVSMILKMVTETGDSILVSHSLRHIYAKQFEPMELHVVTGNDDLMELLALADVLQPKVVLIAPSELSIPSPFYLSALRDHAEKNNNRFYLVDDSAHFDIGSDLNCNMNLRMAARLNLPENLILLFGLIKNTVSADLELSFLLNAPTRWIQAFDVAAELSYSRISYPTQLYYEWLFDDLLSFPFPPTEDGQNPKDASTRETAGVGPYTNGYSTHFNKAAADPVFHAKPIDPEATDVIRMDYGEFEFPVPDAIVKGLFKGLLEPHKDGLGDLVAERVGSYLQATRQTEVEQNRIVLAQGVFPLFGALLTSLKQRLGRAPVVAVPNGTYGPIYATIKYYGGVIEQLETHPQNAFLLTAAQLQATTVKPDLLWLSQPNNPSGLFFEPSQVQAIARYCSENGIYVVADEIFFLLSDHRLGATTPSYLSFASTLFFARRNIFLLDGLAKAFAAGGMRCGFMLCPDDVWARDIQSALFLPPRAALRAWDALYSDFVAPNQTVHAYLDEARKRLSLQRNQLLKLLQKHNIDDGIDTPYRGGLFLLAKMSASAADLARRKKLLINDSEWGRTPGWNRLCFSLQPEKFQQALERLDSYLGE